MIGCGVGAGVAGPKHPGKGLAGAIPAVQPAAKRMEPEALLVGRRRALLVGMGVDQGRIQVQDQRPRRRRAKLPRLLADPGQRRPQRRDPTRIGGQLLGQDAPGGRGRTDLAEQLRLVAEGGKVADAVATVGEHDYKIPQHLAAVISASAHADIGAPAKLAGQPQPVRQLTKQRRPDMATDALAVGDHFEAGTRVGSLHLQGDPPGRWFRPSDAASSLVGRVPCYPAPACSTPTRNSWARLECARFFYWRTQCTRKKK